MTSCLVPSLDVSNGTGENDGMLLVCVFAYDQIDVLRVHLVALGGCCNLDGLLRPAEVVEEELVIVLHL